MRVLVTGGAGYIGSHTCVELLDAGHDVVVVDNLSNSKEESLRRVSEITGREPTSDRSICSIATGSTPCSEVRVDAVIHFAGLKAVGESVEQPMRYYHNNVIGTLNLLLGDGRAGVRTSSSAPRRRSTATPRGCRSASIFRPRPPTPTDAPS